MDTTQDQTSDIRCPTCSKRFSTTWCRNRHLRTVRCSADIPTPPKEPPPPKQQEPDASAAATIEALRARVTSLQQQWAAEVKLAKTKPFERGRVVALLQAKESMGRVSGRIEE